MNIRPIKNEADYEVALAEIERLFDVEAGTPESDQLEVLATLVEAYEDRHYNLPPPDPIDALEYYIDSRGLSYKDLEPYIDTTESVFEILNRKRPLTLDMIRRLAKGTGIPTSILIQLMKQNSKTLKYMRLYHSHYS